jgi:hypothetical protein
MKRLVLAAACAATLASCGIYGPKGNDTGGVIPWSVENESMMLMLAQDACGYYGKRAVITNIHRVYGDFISYECHFGPPLERRAYRDVPVVVAPVVTK